MNSDPRRSVLVIGGGVAGASCAIALAQRGVRVQLVERATFPRNKVCGCCLGPLGVRALDTLGVLEQASVYGAPTSRWIGAFDGKRVELPMPDGLAISRLKLDPLLLEAASAAGADVRERVSAKVVEIGEQVQVELIELNDGTTSRERVDCVVLATGLNASGGSRFLPWEETPSGPFGVSFLVSNNSASSVRPGTVYMACDQDGYVGVVELRDGSVDVAAALRCETSEVSAPAERVTRILERSGLGFPNLEPFTPVLATPRLRRRRSAGQGPILAIGDAAGYVEPFTGEGMTWAMCSGIAAARVIATEPAGDLGSIWRATLRQQLLPRQRLCHRVARALESRWKRRWAAQCLSTFPWLSRPVFSSLNRPAFGV
ncbi:MAG: NAD(P)/FAD-dependent oxidoreductase [Planctomycetota bacterium]